MVPAHAASTQFPTHMTAAHKLKPSTPNIPLKLRLLCFDLTRPFSHISASARPASRGGHGDNIYGFPCPQAVKGTVVYIRGLILSVHEQRMRASGGMAVYH